MDTRAYFTSATFAIVSYKSLGQKSLSELFSVSLINTRKRGNMSSEGLIIWGENSISGDYWWGRRITKKQREMLVLTRKAKSILIGVLLSDGWIQRGKKHWNPKIGIKQSIKNVRFILHLINETGYLLPSRVIQINKNMLRGKIWYNVSIATRALPCIKEVVDLMYEDKRGKLVRSIQGELINYMDEIVLAYWIMGDGAKRNDGIILCTDGFTMREVVLLMNILKIRLGINTTIHKEKGRSRIYINGRELRKIKGLIDKYVIEHFKYKLNNLV